MRVVRIALIIALAAAPLGAIAKEKECPTCGSTLTDSGRCPYCQPKPKVAE